MLKNMKITAKLLVLVLAITIGTLVTVSVVSYKELLDTTTYLSSENANLGLTASSQSKKALLSQSEEYLIKVANAQTDSTNNILAGISTKVTEMSQYMTSLYKNPENFIGRDLPLPDQTEMGVSAAKYMLAPGVEMTDALHDELLLVSNAEYAFRPVLSNDSLLDNVYLGTVSGISYRFSPYNEYDPTYEPRERIWFKAGQATQDRPVWIDTYIDTFGTVCITCAQAFFDANDEFAGVVSIDIMLGKVVDEIMNLKIGESGYAFILDSDMSFIAHPVHPAMDENYTLMTVSSPENLAEVKTVEERDSGLVMLTLDGEDCYLAFTELNETGWKICICIDVNEIIAPANATKAEIDTATDIAQGKIQQTLSNVIAQYVIMFAAIGIVVIVIAFAISGTISRPILKLVGISREIGNGNLEVKAPVLANDEIGELAKSFNSMTNDLKDYIARITSITADKERIEAELNVATHIQKSMLPSISPVFSGRKEFSIFASMEPAKEVGGDFYDFFMVDERHLAIVMADVSGKGVPAALFMVIGKTLINDHTQPGRSLGEVFTEVNHILCESNSEGMFITAFEGVLDLDTGDFEFVNAGHEIPFIYRNGQIFEEYKIKSSFVLAGMDGLKYKTGYLKLEPGDRLFQYTDGVTEATSASMELFGMDRLKNSLNTHKNLAPEQLLPSVKKDIDVFVGDAPQFDDISMLCLDYHGTK